MTDPAVAAVDWGTTRMRVWLLDAKGGSIPLARAAVEQASTKEDPREYLGAIIRGRGGGVEDLRARGEAW